MRWAWTALTPIRRETLPTQQAVECHVPAGGALLMRPRLVHASSRARRGGHRRIIHPEFAVGELPGGLEWHAREQIG